MLIRSPYKGSHSKLVLAFDVGTTFSGISYCILDPGEIPEIRGVTRYPGQVQVGGDSKIPTIIYYDHDGNVRAVGAEAEDQHIEELAKDEQWLKAEWFKLRLHPNAPLSGHVADKIPQLSRGLPPVVDIFADFLRYLHQCAKTFIEQSHVNGVELWRSLTDSAEIILSHPNGWEGAQQTKMLTAAIHAGLISDDDGGRSRLSFVTEGEASLHFCVQNGLTNDAIKNGKGILIVDAGGGTIDISAYRQTSQDIQSFEEIAPPQCHFHGSIFVTGQAKKFIDDLLGESRFSGDIPRIVKSFDKNTKHKFMNPDIPQRILFGGCNDDDPKVNISNGQLKLLGTDVVKFFEPSIQCIVKSIKEQCEASKTEISAVFLVGGFSASDWLFHNVKVDCPEGLDICRPDGHINKAVADGAVSYHIDHMVSARFTKFAYGIETYRKFDALNSEHMRRENTKFMTPEGYHGIRGIFSVILPQKTKVSETDEFSRSYGRSASEKSDLETVSVPIMCYRGNSVISEKWMDEDKSMYSTLCVIKGNTAELCKLLQPRVEEKQFYEIDFEVVLAPGHTALKAFICWKENGVQKRSPAEVIHEEQPVTRERSIF